jgi:acyl-CoA synthetase (AMP-forming)/AMP-acid ligase II
MRDVLAAWAGDRAREAAVVGDRRLSYADLLAEADRHAAAYVGAGVRPGDRVALLDAPGATALASFIGAASIGALWLGLNPQYRREELLQAARDAEPSLLLAPRSIGERDYGQDLAAVAGAVPDLRVVSLGLEGLPLAGPADVARRREAVDPDQPCLLVYTSGSTGRPKGAMLRQSAMLDFARKQVALWPVEPLRCLNYFPINHIGFVLDVALPAMVAGGLQVLLPKFDVDRTLDLMERERITLWISVPSTFQMQLARLEQRTADLSAVQLIVWEGAAMPPELLPRLSAICPRMATNYGMTETTSAVTATPPSKDLAWLARSVGPPFPGVEVRLAEDVVGEVQVRSPGVFAGYWRRPEATAEAFTADGWFRTGDLARADGRGGFEIVGRLKEMFKSGGYNVYPREVELALEAHPAVEMAAVVPAPDPLWQETGVAFVIADGSVDAAALDAWCRERLANYKVPKRFLIGAELPLLPIGKVDKSLLRARARALTETAAA